MKNLKDFVESKGFDVLPLDGKMHRFDHAGPMTGWFRGREIKTPSGMTLELVEFGDWKTDEKYKWQSTDGQTLTPEQLAEAKLAQAEAAKEAAAQIEAEQADAALKCTQLWVAAVKRGSSPYLERKGLPPNALFGTRLDLESQRAQDFGPQTLVPAFDTAGTLHGLQKISQDGFKSFFPGMRIKGCFAPVPEVFALKNGVLYLCEGIATAASIHLATGEPVLACFNAANLVRVAKDAAVRWPNTKLIICADNDAFTQKNGKPWNPGLEYALRAAKACGGIVVTPLFLQQNRGETDFNDLHVKEGIDAVGASIDQCLKIGGIREAPERGPEDAPPPEDQRPGDNFGPPNGGGETTVESPFGGPVDEMRLKISDNGVPKLPSQQRIVSHLLGHFEGKLLKQDRDLFLYTGTHWRWLTLGDHDRLKILIQKVCQNLADMKLLDAAYKLLVTSLPTPPDGIDLFAPHPFAVNFLNGTLHLIREPDHSFRTEFRTHARADYLVNVLPYEFHAPGTPKGDEVNAEFLAMLDRVFDGDADKDQKISAVQEMYGACLVPAFPRLFMCWGGPGTGKSTVLNIARRLVHRDNLCSVSPSEMHGFNMEGMAGKLVNIDTDIPLTEPISDAVVKKIIERKPFRVRRKNVKDLDTLIPSVHLFGGNGIPRTLDGASRAHTRRWTFVEFDKFVPKGDYNLEFWDWVFEQSPQGVLNFALAGLARLCTQKGHFTQPASGVKKMEDWQNAGDLVGQFLSAVEDRDLPEKYNQVIRGPGEKIRRAQLWEVFKEWHKAEFNFDTRVGKKTVFEALRVKKIEESRTKEGRYFAGIGVHESPDATF